MEQRMLKLMDSRIWQVFSMAVNVGLCVYIGLAVNWVLAIIIFFWQVILYLQYACFQQQSEMLKLLNQKIDLAQEHPLYVDPSKYSVLR